MKPQAAIFAVLAAGSAVALAACSSINRDPAPITLGPYQPSAIVIATTEPATTLSTVCALIRKSARPNEHLEVVDPNFSAGQVLITTVTPKAPSRPGPVSPPGLPTDPTSYQTTVYRTKHHAYEVKIAADRRALKHIFGLRLGQWSDTVCAHLSRTVPASGWGARTRAAASDGSTFFADLSATGVSLGTRKVIVIFATEATAHAVLTVRPDSLSGATVVIVNYQGGTIRQRDWRTDFRKAGAAHTMILVPAAVGELPTAVGQALTVG